MTKNPIIYQVSNEVRHQIHRQILNPSFKVIDGKAMLWVRNQVSEIVWGKINDTIWRQVKLQIKNKVENPL